MTREELLEKICPSDNINDCCSEQCLFGCDDCKVTMEYMLDEYDKQIKADIIDEFLKMLDEDIVKYEYSSLGLAMPRIRKMAEQLKEQNK